MRSAAQKAKPATTLDKLREGLTLQGAGEYEKAQRIYKQILKKQPNNKDALHLLGVSYRQLGFPKRAIEFITKAIKLDPNQGSFYANLARAKSDLPNIPADEILELSEKAITLDSSLPEAHNLRALALKKLDRNEEAEELLKKLVELYPHNPEINRNYGVLLREQKRFEEALDFFITAMRFQPNEVETIVEISRCRTELKQHDVAEKELFIALKRNPNNGKLKHEIARLMFSVSRVAEGLPYALDAVRDNPNDHQRQVTLAVHYLKSGNPHKALKHLTEAKRLTQGITTNIDWNISLTFLALGDLEKGWALHPNRFIGSGVPGVIKRTFPEHRVWLGEDISDKTILVWTDQGVGDTIRSGTIFPDLIKAAGKVIYEGPRKTHEMFRRAFPEVEVRVPSVGEAPDYIATADDFDCQICISDLARYFRGSIAAFQKAQTPAFTFDQNRAQELHARLGDRANGPIVGIGWRSKNLDTARARYYLSVIDYLPIVQIDGVTFVNLQYKSIDREVKYLIERTNGNVVDFPDVDLFDDLDDAMALTSICDIVVSPSTTVAVLPGLLDMPVIRFGDYDSVGQLGEDYLPWFPSTKYFVIDEEKTTAEFVPTIKNALLEKLADVSIDDRLRRIGLKS
ncbi:putative TPR repeat-containing protein [Roseibium sp. TrichSKD4]|uniref:tetratricopeptide repeat protein n=1 Tax=Roseibium sp. TrichSKD4 TaxID=744980 RepID=UPI0001E57789|nr:tetratricopeptide repeat protein [Roseibium sp. TrichSKD4]EFO29544.1 putative TPR repeat-containing protein [Roseibium sp. TrichSKD4]